MSTWIGLFRAINVGGRRVLPMAALKEDLLSLGLTDVRTYIQSGNVVFGSSARSPSTLAKKITARIEQRHGFRPELLLLRPQDVQQVVDHNPFPQATSDPKTLHCFFLAAAAAAADHEAIETAKRPSERYVLTSQVFYLHAPQGVARSKLAANVERYLGVATTARNFRTVTRLWEMVSAGS